MPDRHPPQFDHAAFEEFAVQAYGWTVTYSGELAGLTSGDMGYDDAGINLGVLVADAIGHVAGTHLSNQISDKLFELVSLCREALQQASDA